MLVSEGAHGYRAAAPRDGYAEMAPSVVDFEAEILEGGRASGLFADLSFVWFRSRVLFVSQGVPG
jgi:hypothetical protein